MLLNGNSPFLILARRAFLLLIPFILLACGSEEHSTGQGTGSEEKGMLEKGSDSEELLGRIRTLKDKYGKLQEPPSHLSDSSVSHWERSLSRADSILDTLGGKLQKKGDEGPERSVKRRIDRILQRLAVQARSMENAKGGKEGRPSP